MLLDQHCSRSITMFGKDYKEVHVWLDEFAGKPEYGMRHRRVRHHIEGVRWVRENLGAEAALAALQHVTDDLREEGWKEGDPIPKDERDYVKIGFF